MADTAFRRLAAPVLAMLVLAVPAAAQPAAPAPADPLAPARAHYNAGRFEDAIQAAKAVLGTVGAPASLIIGRAGLEQFRTTADAAQLTAARAALSHVDASQLSERDRLDLVVGLGEALFFDEHFQAAADLFESILDDVAALGPGPRDQLLDWWATAVDRHVRGLPVDKRAEAFDRLVARMEGELRKDPTSAAAAYWVAAASFARGHVERAWDAAVSGWVRGILTVDRGMALRPDLDRLVRDSIIPERVKRIQSTASNGEAQATEASLLAEWALFKEQWARP
jgi:tetratricopeptide (TPR) repeat protein